MDISSLLRGVVIGFSIAAPVGPIGVLCIRRTLADGRLSGLLSGLGAATADAFYGGVAGFGLTFISSFLISQQFWLRLIGGLFLCSLGIQTLVSAPTERPASAQSRGLLSAYTSTVALTLTNPLTILSFAAIFAGLGAANADGNYTSAAVLVLGVFFGSALWWLLLSGGVGLVQAWLNPSRLRWVNRLSGVIISVFGIVALLSVRA